MVDLAACRRALLGPDASTFNGDPVHVVWAEGVWMWDGEGRRYLDRYNCVPHVSLCNPRVVKATCGQAATLLKTLDEPDCSAQRAALIKGYLSQRDLDPDLLDLFIAIRPLAYVGWTFPRVHEGGRRDDCFVAVARELCAACLNEDLAIRGRRK